MPIPRRSSLQVALDRLNELKRLEKQKKALEKDAADISNPFHFAAIAAVAKIAIAIATIVRAIRRHRPKKKGG